MFERFSRDARAVVVSAQEVCRALGADEVRPVHLLVALTEAGGATRATLATHGLSPDDVSAALGAPPVPTSQSPLDSDDAAALRTLGIDLDVIRDAVERRFGAGALDADDESTMSDDDPQILRDPARSGTDPGAADRSLRRFGLGGHVPFARGTKKALELAVREAIHLRSGRIGTEHLALGVLRADDDAVRLVLRSLAVDAPTLRRALEGNAARRTA
ncbi:MAG: Clp protease N-terminal domain-containing protein [Phycicoccus sp.]